jgi:small subunit ribosomal protein S6
MRLYESVFIARQDISTTQVESMADEFAGIITNAGGTVHKREYWGLRSLAYRIKKNRKGHYIMFNLETDGPTLKEYERIMGLNEDVLRFLNIRIEEVDEAPSIIMQNKGERNERGDRDRVTGVTAAIVVHADHVLTRQIAAHQKPRQMRQRPPKTRQLKRPHPMTRAAQSLPAARSRR